MASRSQKADHSAHGNCASVDCFTAYCNHTELACHLFQNLLCLLCVMLIAGDNQEQLQASGFQELVASGLRTSIFPFCTLLPWEPPQNLFPKHRFLYIYLEVIWRKLILGAMILVLRKRKHVSGETLRPMAVF